MKKNYKYLTLKEVEGVGSTHDSYLKRSVKERVKALDLVIDALDLASFIGGAKVDSPPIRCDWAVEKEFFPGVSAIFIYSSADEEFDSQLQILFYGEALKEIKGEDLATLSIATLNHMLRYVRKMYSDKNLPPMCRMV
ncbi:MAG: hypothetical protein DDT40_00768 [candidate division WS2 bacterium]|uniref:DUF3786 domain-containing protein n=1 Tax=Psychracetigena formicireducens TaxID=2986056 RepID=A0A9E2BH18_PSYF1|nr:hypothetical protein [Candidatus Psychracetigena formicireducens]MBT9145418.1 hypothetical protein [Candidatus Psychracetigena formicireducens]MBT9150596.1 hypothetical protein [Candidatus Psychracetigena formicireducens]